MIKEFIAHTRMIKFRTVGIAHWLVMIGFGGMLLFFRGVRTGHQPRVPLVDHRCHLRLAPVGRDLGIGNVVGIVTLIVIRQLNHPRVPERISRFSGSRFVLPFTRSRRSCWSRAWA